MPNEPTLAGLLSGTRLHRSWCNDAWRRASLDCVVAIPALDEATRITRCLASLSEQTQAAHGVLVFVNGTTDDTFQAAVDYGHRHALPLHVIDADLPAHRRDAGAARCAAMHLAWKSLASPEGALFTTDADSIVPRNWIERYRALLASGYDMVAGITDICAGDDSDMPRSLKARGRLEQRYERCLDALECRLDPVAHDPWPRHYQASGANLAARASAIDHLAGLAWPSHGEDVHLVTQAEEHGLRVRHDTSCRVQTSGRIFGRARGGMADTMRHRILEPDSPCDGRLEALERAYFRARVRRAFRDLHALGTPGTGDVAAFARRIRLPVRSVADALCSPCFAAAWSLVERHSPRLRREPIRPSQLLRHCVRGEALLARLGNSDVQTEAASLVNAP